MKIPIFVSCPTTLSETQENCRKMIVKELDRLGLEPRALGRTDYPTDAPLKEVFTLARHCAGGVILGFSQVRVDSGVWKEGTPDEAQVTDPVRFPTPWNHLEAGILCSLRVPLVVFKEDGISGGIFDHGVTDVFINRMPTPALPAAEKKALGAVLMKWQADVRTYYYKL